MNPGVGNNQIHTTTGQGANSNNIAGSGQQQTIPSLHIQ